MERMTERSEGNERNEGGKKMHKFGKYWNCSAWNHLYTTGKGKGAPALRAYVFA